MYKLKEEAMALVSCGAIAAVITSIIILVL